MNKLKELSLDKILQTRTYTVVVLKAPETRFSIYMEPHIGQTLQSFFSHEKSPRPQTFEFLDRAFLGLEMEVVRVVIYELEDSTFYSKILFHQKNEGLDRLIEVDARPSDSLIIALRHKAPLYCTENVLQKTIPFEE